MEKHVYKIKGSFLQSRALVGGICLVLGLGACGPRAQFGFVPESDTFKQNESSTNKKIDILWVVDNSGSMDTSQKNLAANVGQFIEEFQKKNFDFQMAVTTTDGYLDMFNLNSRKSDLKDGSPRSGPTGYPVFTRVTPNLKNNFLATIQQGIMGSGDERAFQSIRAALKNPRNASFLRPQSYLAVIILSDEDDGSNPTETETYDSAKLEDVEETQSFLTSLTKTSSSLPMFSVSAITVTDETCLKKVNSGAQKIGERYLEIAARTGGVAGSICDNFAETLSRISGRILQLLTQFPLSRKADASTIKVWIDGTLVPESAQNGWTYDLDTNSLSFHGDFVPSEGASIKVDFTPVVPK